VSSPFHEWLQLFGDPTIAGWACFLGYFAGAFLCLRVLRGSSAREPGHRAWIFVTAALFLLGVNKQLDLQTLLISELRALVGADPAWEYRRVFASVVVGALSTLLFTGGGYAMYRLRSARTSLNVVVLATVLVTAVAMARAVKGPLDQLLQMDVVGPGAGIFDARVEEVIELALLTTIAVSARRFSSER